MTSERRLSIRSRVVDRWAYFVLRLLVWIGAISGLSSPHFVGASVLRLGLGSASSRRRLGRGLGHRYPARLVPAGRRQASHGVLVDRFHATHDRRIHVIAQEGESRSIVIGRMPFKRASLMTAPTRLFNASCATSTLAVLGCL